MRLGQLEGNKLVDRIEGELELGNACGLERDTCLVFDVGEDGPWGAKGDNSNKDS